MLCIKCRIGRLECVLPICNLGGERHQASSKRNEEDYVVFVLDSLYLNYCVILLCCVVCALSAQCIYWNGFFSCVVQQTEGRRSPAKYVACACEGIRIATQRYLSFFGDSNLTIKLVVVWETENVLLCLPSFCPQTQTHTHTLCRLFLAVNVRCLMLCRLCRQIRSDKVNLYVLTRWESLSVCKFFLFAFRSRNYTYGNSEREPLSVCGCVCVSLFAFVAPKPISLFMGILTFAYLHTSNGFCLYSNTCH